MFQPVPRKINTWNFTHYKTQLNNGVILLETIRPSLSTVSICACFKTGAKNESNSQNGISHFLEHMIFRGTKKFPDSFLLNMEFEKIGGSINASTSADTTEYTVSLPIESVEKGMELLCEMIMTPVFNGLETERKIIIEEILEDLDENENPIDIDLLSRNRVWANSPLKNPITGTIDNVSSFTKKDLINWYSTYYTGSNLIFGIAGDFNREKTSALAQKLLSQLPVGTIFNHPDFNPPFLYKPDYLHAKKQGSQTKIRMSFLTPGQSSKDYPAVSLLLRLLDDGMSTPLHRNIFEKMGLAYNIGADLESYSNTGVLNIDAIASHENILPIAKETLDIITSFLTASFSDEDIIKAKNRAIWDILSLQDYPFALNCWFAEQEILKKNTSLEKEIDKVKAVTIKEIENIANGIFKKDSLFLTTVGTLPSKTRASLEKICAQFNNTGSQ